MLKNISFLTPASALALASILIACVVVTDDGATQGDTSTAGDGDGDTGDGDGDATTGDGDGDTGDGDGDTGDGDGDSGDGDGDSGDGDGDGDPVGVCGWVAEAGIPGYYCGGAGEDPDGLVPLACPDGLVDGAPCGDLVTGAGCCDANGDNWYCADGDLTVFESCAP